MYVVSFHTTQSLWEGQLFTDAVWLSHMWPTDLRPDALPGSVVGAMDHHWDILWAQ